jgi:rubrerythrin
VALSKEDIEHIARESAQSVLEGLHRYAVDYKEPESVEQGLQDSMIEEKTAADWYRKRAQNVADYHGDTKTIAVYEEIAVDEDEHYEQFKQRLQEIKSGPTSALSGKKKPTRDDVKVTVWEERDRLHIGIIDKATEQTSYGDWWDEDARQMFEDGFFSHKHGLENSVLEYAEDMGILAK